MGSLMAGWLSRSPDPKAVKYQRNRSFTKGEIESYWRLKKRTEEDHLRAISDLSENSQEGTYTDSEGKLHRSSSLPVTDGRENIMSDSKADLEKMRTNDWWTRSNWAFLNEPPVTAPEGASSKYAPQYHVTNLSSSTPNTGAGGAGAGITA